MLCHEILTNWESEGRAGACWRGVRAVCRSHLDSAPSSLDNADMELQGRFQNGVVVFDGQPALPEGAAVTVTYLAPASPRPTGKKRIQVPLVRSARPGTLELTNEQIGAILDEEDAAPRH
jgi:hypothetical protein